MRTFQFLLTVYGVLLTAATYSQKKCDCSIIPYKPDSCFNVCSGNVLKNATDVDLQLILGLNDTLTNKIMQINRDSSLTAISFKTYLSALNGKEVETLIQSINRLNKEQNEYLNKPISEKKTIMAEMREGSQLKKG